MKTFICLLLLFFIPKSATAQSSPNLDAITRGAEKDLTIDGQIGFFKYGVDSENNHTLADTKQHAANIVGALVLLSKKHPTIKTFRVNYFVLYPSGRIRSKDLVLNADHLRSIDLLSNRDSPALFELTDAVAEQIR